MDREKVIKALKLCIEKHQCCMETLKRTNQRIHNDDLSRRKETMKEDDYEPNKSDVRPFSAEIVI